MAVAVDPTTAGVPTIATLQTRINSATTTNFGAATILGYLCATSTAGTFQLLDNGVALSGVFTATAGSGGTINFQGANNLQVTTAGTIDITFFYLPS